MSVWIAIVVVVLTGLLVARRWLPDRATVSDTAYDAYRALVPAPRPTVRLVTKRIAKVCRKQRVVMPFGQKAVLPRAFLVDVSAGEYAVVEPLLDAVQEAVSASLLRTAREKQWLHAGAPRIVVQESETVAEGRPEVGSTTLPGPGALRGGADLPREATSTFAPGPGHEGAAYAAPAPDSPAYAGPGYAGLGYVGVGYVGAGYDGAGYDGAAYGGAGDEGAGRGAAPMTSAGEATTSFDPAATAPVEATRSAAGARAPLVPVPPLAAAAAPGRPTLVPVGRDPGAEPTAAKVRGSGIHRLRGGDGEPDIVVTRDAVVVGRAEDCDVTVAYPSASRHHLRLRPTAAGCRVEDLDSRHGTRVNGALVRQPVLLRARDTLQLGSMGPCWTYQPLGASTAVVHSGSEAVS